MTYLEELHEIWDSDEVKDLSIVVSEALNLLNLAKKSGEDIPIELEVEILLAANYSLSFGSTIDESQHLFSILNKVIKTSASVPEKNLRRLTCTAINSILGIMASDSTQGTRNVNTILTDFDVDPKTSRVSILQRLLNLAIEIIDADSLENWNLELIGYAITLYSMLEVLGKPPENLVSLHILSKPFKDLSTREDNLRVENWTSEWLKKSDYFRFILLMITNMNAGEDQWIENAQRLTSV